MRRSSRPCRSWANVSSWLTDLTGRSESTRRSSIPLASSSRRVAAAWPTTPRRATGGHRGEIADRAHAEAVEPFVSRRPDAPQTPHREADAGSRSPRQGRISNTPGPGSIAVGTGLRLGLDRCHLGEEHVGGDADRTRQPRSLGDFGADPVGHSRGPPNSRTDPVTSRNASSSEIDSTCGVNDRKTSNTWALAAA